MQSLSRSRCCGRKSSIIGNINESGLFLICHLQTLLQEGCEPLPLFPVSPPVVRTIQLKSSSFSLAEVSAGSKTTAKSQFYARGKKAIFSLIFAINQNACPPYLKDL